MLETGRPAQVLCLGEALIDRLGNRNHRDPLDKLLLDAHGSQVSLAHTRTASLRRANQLFNRVLIQVHPGEFLQAVFAERVTAFSEKVQVIS